MLEAMPVPYGLVRYGVAPDHPEVKVRSDDCAALFLYKELFIDIFVFIAYRPFNISLMILHKVRRTNQ